ncbi:hypothetical protein A2154_03860 [Candidatus Gottesmanbacteria bacterium RBG_16_43_7]|uniref:Uncharacterized protein n=1 Tax=Candidatus Gottesmanbacteria bacterium RBG_16_43_7 TaxID=1798373 RepID=A0A1F5Z8U9_9BACT|nr:MAG: hypothetical protein A2154_03860 [Candidatus Gottesmanbacteria bacterium RBG_16_43_7]
MRTKKLAKILLHTTDSIIGNLTDFMLVQLFWTLGSIGATTPYKLHKAMDNAQSFVEYEFNYQTIKRSVYSLASKGFIKRLRNRSRLEFEITRLGKKRLTAIFPYYQSKRPWDGYLYLVSYDIPVKSNYQRNRLRTYLIKIGCALLQQSFWITPYNPTDILSEFSIKYHLPGTILVSKLGKDGSIGDEKIEDLVTRAYKLDEITELYQEFIDTYSNKIKPPNIETTMLEYYKILKKDPQLPFELLPKNFPAQKAYSIVAQYLFQNVFGQNK